jgi:hypothetical protein
MWTHTNQAKGGHDMHTSTKVSQHRPSWDDVRDSAFFRIVSALFDPAFVYGAGVLLMLNDDQFEESRLTE